MTGKEVVFTSLRISILLYSLVNSMAFLYYRTKTCVWFVTLFLKLVIYLVNEWMGIVKLFKGTGAIDAMKTTSIWNAWSHKFHKNCWFQIILPLLLLCSVAQSYLTLCDSMDCSTPGFSVHGIFQTRILEWHAISYPGDFPGPGIEPVSLASLPLAGGETGFKSYYQIIVIKVSENWKKKKNPDFQNNWGKFLLIWWNLILKIEIN